MNDELKQRFTRRITQANKTELIVILYEMVMEYLTDAKKALVENDIGQFHKEIKRAKRCMDELLNSVHLEYEIGRRIRQLYLYVNRELIKADTTHQEERIDSCIKVIQNLYEAYVEVSKLDHSEPVMANTQSIYAGLTYGKKDLTENLVDHVSNRGFLV